MLPFALGIPLIGGLIGLIYAGTNHETQVATTPPGSSSTAIKMAWYVQPLLIIGGILLVIIIIKGVLKKQGVL